MVLLTGHTKFSVLVKCINQHPLELCYYSVQDIQICLTVFRYPISTVTSAKVSVERVCTPTIGFPFSVLQSLNTVTNGNTVSNNVKPFRSNTPYSYSQNVSISSISCALFWKVRTSFWQFPSPLIVLTSKLHSSVPGLSFQPATLLLSASLWTWRFRWAYSSQWLVSIARIFSDVGFATA